MSVDESMVIFGPMLHVGWASASSSVTEDRSARLRPRNGPPLAVSTIRASSPTDRLAPRATISRAPGSAWTTSIAWVPMEPVEPTRLTVVMRWLPAEVEETHQIVGGGDDEEQGVDPVEHAAVSRKDPAHVLD